MNVVYTWEWGPMMVQTVEGIENVVIGVYWKCVAVDTDSGIEAFDTGNIPAPPPDPNNFITLDNLTMNDIQVWSQVLNKEYVENECLQYIESQLNPVTLVNAPIL